MTDVFFLISAEPINVIGTAEDSPTEIDVRQIQLRGNETMDLFNKNISGKKVKVTDELIHSHTAHHHTAVLILVSDIDF